MLGPDGRPTARSQYDRLQFIRRDFEFFINDQIIVIVILAYFLASYLKSLFDDKSGIQAAPCQPFAQDLIGRGQDKHADGIRSLPFYNSRSLHIDIQEDIEALLRPLVNELSGCSIIVAMNLGPFQKIIRSNQGFKSVAVHKEIFYAVPLSSAWRPRGIRYGKLYTLHPSQHAVDQYGFPCS
jgi:hypothetical protein